jgi:hypothetical protein
MGHFFGMPCMVEAAMISNASAAAVGQCWSYVLQQGLPAML